MTEPRPNRRIQIVAVGFAAAALATAVVAVVVVATRSTPAPPPPPPPGNVVEDRDVTAADVIKLDKSYDSHIWTISSSGLSVDDDALRKALGLDARDAITAVSGRTIKSDLDMHRAVFDLSMLEAKTAYIEVMRDHRAVLYRWKIDGDLREARRGNRLSSGSGAPWGPLTGSGSGSATIDPLVPYPADPLVSTVKVIDDTHIEVPKSTVDAVMADPDVFVRGARIVPSMQNGHPNGFKLYAVRPTSLWAAIHLQNGDTIVSINGADLSSPSQSLDVFRRVKSAKQFVIDMIRRGSPMTLTIDVK